LNLKGEKMVIKKTKANNGVEIIFEETPHFFKLTVGTKTWYWSVETGQYDGVSFDWNED